EGPGDRREPRQSDRGSRPALAGPVPLAPGMAPPVGIETVREGGTSMPPALVVIAKSTTASGLAGCGLAARERVISDWAPLGGSALVPPNFGRPETGALEDPVFQHRATGFAANPVALRRARGVRHGRHRSRAPASRAY